MVFYWRVETFKRLFIIIIIIIIIIQPLILRSNSWPRTNSTMVRTSASSLWGGKPFSKACIEINQSIIIVVYFFTWMAGRIVPNLEYIMILSDLMILEKQKKITVVLYCRPRIFGSTWGACG